MRSILRNSWTRIAVATCGFAALGISTNALLAGSASPSSPTAYARGGDMMKKGDIIDTATGPGMQKVTTVVTAIKAADLVDALKGEGPFTVFAPTNDAFDKLPAGTVESLLKPENKEKLKSILLFHVHAGDAIKAADVKTMSLTTLNGKPLSVKTDGSGNVWINDAKVIKTDVVCSNGVIHWIDTVLMP
jgi:uncharacterized surface protein with fasciclin (FAS1) repeats